MSDLPHDRLCVPWQKRKARKGSQQKSDTEQREHELVSETYWFAQAANDQTPLMCDVSKVLADIT